MKLLVFTQTENELPNGQNVKVSTKILSSTTVFNIDYNQKCFLNSKSSYLNDFCMIM